MGVGSCLRARFFRRLGELDLTVRAEFSFAFNPRSCSHNACDILAVTDLSANIDLYLFWSHEFCFLGRQTWFL